MVIGAIGFFGFVDIDIELVIIVDIDKIDIGCLDISISYICLFGNVFKL